MDPFYAILILIVVGAYLIISTAVSLWLTVAIHELGHYWACRYCVHPVTAIVIGRGRLLLDRVSKRGERWVISLNPWNGFIVCPFNNTSLQKAFLVLLAGPWANTLVGVGVTIPILVWPELNVFPLRFFAVCNCLAVFYTLWPLKKGTDGSQIIEIIKKVRAAKAKMATTTITSSVIAGKIQ